LKRVGDALLLLGLSYSTLCRSGNVNRHVVLELGLPRLGVRGQDEHDLQRVRGAVLGHGLGLIDEYHHIMRSYLKDPEAMREHLTARGVKIPAQALHTG
jgi:hypothetical protein